MFSITINEKGGETRRLEFDKAEVTIGRVQGNDIILPKGNVSKRHSRIVFKDGKFIIVDLKSTNGTYVNGRKITSPLVIKGTDKVYIGDFILSVDDAEAGEAAGDVAAPPPPVRRPTMPPPPPRKIDRATAQVASPDDEGGPPNGAGDDAANKAPFQFDDAGAAPPPLAEPEPLRAADEPDEQSPPEQPRPEPRSRPTPAAVRTPSPTPVAPRPIMNEVEASPPVAPPRPVEPPPPRVAASAEPSAPARPVTSMAQPRPISPPPPRAAAPTTPVMSSSPAPTPAPLAPRERKASTPAVAAVPRTPLSSVAAAGPPPAAALAPPASTQGPSSSVLKLLAARVGARLDASTADPAEIERVARDLVESLTPEDGLSAGADRDALAREVVAELQSLGPLAALLADAEVREINVVRHDRIFVDRGGQVTLSDKAFTTPEALVRAIERMAPGHPGGGLIEARLADGTMATAALPPLTARGATLTLRRPRPTAPSLAELTTQNAISAGMAEVLKLAVAARRNILIAGGPGSGRSALLAALAGAIPEGERVISVESREDLQLPHPHWIPLTGASVGHALRMRPDRLLVDDVQSDGALSVVHAFASMAGVMAAGAGLNAGEAIDRLEALARLSPGAPELGAVRGAIADHLHLVIQLSHRQDGFRVVQMAEIAGSGTDGRVALNDVFLYKSEGGGGRFTATGHVPSFASNAPPSVFRI